MCKACAPTGWTIAGGWSSVGPFFDVRGQKWMTLSFGQEVAGMDERDGDDTMEFL